MAEGTNLHPIHGLNPVVRFCKYCGVDEGLYFLGNSIEGKSPPSEEVECFKFCENNDLIVLIEVDDDGNPVGYRVTMDRRVAIKKYGIEQYLPGWHYVRTSYLKLVMKDDYRKTGGIHV